MPLAVFSLLTSAVFFVAGFYHRRDLVGRNIAAGIRTSHTMRSDAAWYAAHRTAAPYFTRAAVFPTLAGVIILFTLRQPDWFHAALFLGGHALLAVYVLRGSRAGIQAAKETEESRRTPPAV